MRKILLIALGIALLVPASASAGFEFQPNAATLGFGPAMIQDGLGTTFYLAGRVDLGTFADRVVWDTGLHWWQKSESQSFSFFGETTSMEATYRDVAWTTGVKYLFPVSNPQWVPYARGGLGLNFVNASVKTTSGTALTGDVSAGETDFGFYLGGGAAYRYGSSMLIGVEGTFNVTDADHLLLGVTASFPFGSGGAPAE